jgi:hypothetical protein
MIAIPSRDDCKRLQLAVVSLAVAADHIAAMRRGGAGPFAGGTMTSKPTRTDTALQLRDHALTIIRRHEAKPRPIRNP